jgi:hypothetical protein
MAAPNSKTVTLARGRHRSPHDGVCVMELASMLAGEPFTDQPATVSPTVAAFLRAYNDAATEEQRQRLYRYAAESLRTRTTRALERRRARLCLRWLDRIEPRPTLLARRLRLAVALIRPELVAATLGRAASHADAAAGRDDCLRMVDVLIAATPGRSAQVQAPERAGDALIGQL